MRVLLLAYEFPPSPSPQSLRWSYLSRELAAKGVHVRVIAPGLSQQDPGLGTNEFGVEVIHAFPGLLKGTLDAVRRGLDRFRGGASRSGESEESASEVLSSSPLEAPRVPLNWKGRAVEWLQRCVAGFRFPDARAEWNVSARRVLARELVEFAPHWVVTSHEPASVLYLGLYAKARGYRWMADLGDPVLACYTPPRWRRRAFKLEARVCAVADRIVVTTEATRALLIARHKASASRIGVVTQGFDISRIAGGARSGSASGQGCVGSGQLKLVYTGSFYPFRSPAALVQAVLQVEGVEIWIASHSKEESVLAAHRQAPERVQFLGPLAQEQAQRLQDEADVLVDLGNDDPVQVPGKLYEYFGACRPILHVGPEGSAGAGLVAELARGWVCENSVGALVALLRELVHRHASGRLEEGLDLTTRAISRYSWTSAAEQLLDAMHEA